MTLMEDLKYPFVRCDKCGGKLYAGGITPRRQTMEEFLGALRSKGKGHAVCTHCGCIATLRVIEPGTEER